MSDIAKLTVALYANSAQFTSELKKSQKSAKTWSDSINKTFSTAAKTTATAAVAAVGSLALLYKQQSEWIDQTAKHADTLGITTEALTQFRHAAELTGVGAKNLDTSLQRMTRRVAEAAAGTGEAKDALNEMGVSAKKLNESTPEEQLYILADAFSQVENQSDRVRYAFKLFDSEGVKMANMLAGGADGLRTMADEADVLGITLSRVDAAKIEMANDAMYKVSASTQAWSKTIAVELAPLLAAVSDEITNATKAAGGFGVVTAEVFDGIVKGIAFASDVWRGWDLIIKSGVAVAQGYKLAMVSVWQSVIDGAVLAGETITKAVVWPLQQTLEAAGLFSDSAAEMAASLEAMTTFKAPQLFNIADAQIEYSQAMWDLRDLASQPLPSEGIEAWYEDAKKRIQETAELYAANVNRNTGTNSPTEIGTDGSKKELQAVNAFREATNQLTVEWQRRLALQASGEQQAATQEAFAYQDRSARLSQQFQAAYDAAANNQALQQQLESEYFANRELLWTEHQANLTLIESEQLAAREEQNKGFWQRYGESLQENMTNMDELTANMLNNFSRNMGSAFESVIFESQSLGDAFKNMAEGMSRSVINALGQMAGQWLAYQAVQLAVGKTTAVAGAAGLAANAQAASLQAGLNAFASTAAIPIVGPVAAPGAMASALAVTTPIAASIAALAAGGVAGMAHNGISSVPREGTWLLDKGERVYTNDSAQKLDLMYDAIMGGNQGASSGNASPPVKVVINDAPPGTYATSEASLQKDEDGEKWVISVFCKDAQYGGQSDQLLQGQYGLARKGRF